MPTYDMHSIANLVGQLGGNHQQAAQALSNLPAGQQVDPSDPQHARLLQQMGVDPQQLQSGAYQQQLDNQSQPDFQGYQPGQDLGQQAPKFGGDGNGSGNGQAQQDQYGQGQSGQDQGQYGQGQQDQYGQSQSGQRQDQDQDQDQGQGQGQGQYPQGQQGY